jgi:hypothetical protein
MFPYASPTLPYPRPGLPCACPAVPYALPASPYRFPELPCAFPVLPYRFPELPSCFPVLPYACPAFPWSFPGVPYRFPKIPSLLFLLFILFHRQYNCRWTAGLLPGSHLRLLVEPVPSHAVQKGFSCRDLLHAFEPFGFGEALVDELK